MTLRTLLQVLFFEKWKYALEFFEIYSNKFKCSVLARQVKKSFFMVIICNYLFLIRIVSNAPKSFHFRSLCLFFSQQSFCFLFTTSKDTILWSWPNTKTRKTRCTDVPLTDPLLARDMISTYQMPQITINHLIPDVVARTPTPRAIQLEIVNFSQEHQISLHLTLKFSSK